MTNYVDRETYLNALVVLLQGDGFTDAGIEPEQWDTRKYRIT